MITYDELVSEVKQFSDDRDWDQFHTPVNLAKSICIEAGELLECFQWSDNFNKEDVCEEMADILAYLLNMADKLDVDLLDITNKKMKKNEIKYPVEKSKGKADKYNRL